MEVWNDCIYNFARVHSSSHSQKAIMSDSTDVAQYESDETLKTADNESLVFLREKHLD